MPNPTVAVIMGSKSDLEVVAGCTDVLKELGIEHSLRVMSAHRTPGEVAAYSSGAEDAGFKVIITAAGKAAHLGGVVAAHTRLPVIAIPVASGKALAGLDALLSTAQMPGGVPVAAMSLGRAGAKNAAILAARILALADTDIAAKLDSFTSKMRDAVSEDDAEVGY